MKTRTPIRRETNRNRVGIARLALLLLSLILSSGRDYAIPIDASHQAPNQTGATINKATAIIYQDTHLVACSVTLGNSTYFPTASMCQLPNTDALGWPVSYSARRLEIGINVVAPVSVIQGQVLATEAVYYANTVELSNHIVSPKHEIGPGSSVIIHSPVTLTMSTTFFFRAPAGISANQGVGTVVIAGALATDIFTGRIDIIGDINHLPVTLITATQITGNWSAGVLPPGTQLLFTNKAIRLVRRARK